LLLSLDVQLQTPHLLEDSTRLMSRVHILCGGLHSGQDYDSPGVSLRRGRIPAYGRLSAEALDGASVACSGDAAAPSELASSGRTSESTSPAK
jgi:hypothetical protein